MNEDWEIDSMSERLYSLFGKKKEIVFFITHNKKGIK